MGLFASVGAASLLALNATAQDTASTTTAAATLAPAAPADTGAVKLPYGVEDVLKLSRAQVSEDIILNYIHNSGTIYNLAPKDIVYLRNEGVSDRVINAMMDQRKNVPAEAATQAALANAAAAPQVPVSSDVTAVPVPQYLPTYVQPAPVYIQPEPAYAPASTLYIIPYYSTRFDYPNAFPYGYGYYSGYYPYWGSSFAYGFGYHGRGWGYRGYYHGGHYGGHYGYRGHR